MTVGNRRGFKRLAGRVFSLLPKAASRRIILSYHAVGSGPWSTREESFQAQLAWLGSNAALRSLEHILEAPGDTTVTEVALTFDDGYRSVLTAALPVLQKAGVPAAVFVNTSRIGTEDRLSSDPAQGYYPGEEFLRWDELQELQRHGWTIGSHGTSHPDLTTQAPTGVRDQLRRSKEVLEDRLGTSCRHFAYPFGRNNVGVRMAAHDAGYAWALCSTHGTVGRAVDPFAVPRIDVRNSYEFDDFRALIRGDWDYLGLVQSARHRLRWYA